MSSKAPHLNGDDEFWDDRITHNPPSQLQRKHMDFIKEHLGIEFLGKNSKEAYYFINKYHQKAVERKGMKSGTKRKRPMRRLRDDFRDFNKR
jgi:hypothetical protein